ncbi:hypothetical protein LXL04_034432 [Taraxacum kok-saghyz]
MWTSESGNMFAVWIVVRRLFYVKDVSIVPAVYVGCYDKKEFMTCVLFDIAATPLLGYSVDQLGAGDPAWISNFLYESVLGIHVVFGIKIDNFNLPPKFERRFTVT